MAFKTFFTTTRAVSYTHLDVYKRQGKDKGRIMKTLMPKVKGKADGKLVNQLLMKHMQ